MDVTIIQTISNISNPWPLEQEPGQKQGLLVPLYDYFYAGFREDFATH